MGFTSGVVTGAALMFIFDPVSGRARRARVRDKLVRARHEVAQSLDEAAHDLRNRGQGLAVELEGRLRREQVPDEQLVDRVRSKLGRFTSHPHAIEVTAHDGSVRLSGPVLAGEASQLVRRTRRVRGVRAVEDALDRHASADSSRLQGGSGVGHTFELAKRNWSPGWKLLVGAGVAIALVAAR
jgi:hypothetical protein